MSDCLILFLDNTSIAEEPGSVYGSVFLKVKGPTRNLHNLIYEVVLVTEWGATFGNQWEYQDHLSIQNLLAFSRALDPSIISLNNAHPFSCILMRKKTRPFSCVFGEKGTLDVGKPAVPYI